MFWTPAFAGVTLQETFYEISKIGRRKTKRGRYSGSMMELEMGKAPVV
jgi:hypothetical protein